MKKVLMVCLGNICRSPLAHGILDYKVKKAKLKVVIDSAGTGSWHIDSPPDIRSIDTANKYGIDISNQKARQIVKEDLDRFDVIYVMDNQNQKDVIGLCSNEKQKNKIKLILDELSNQSIKSVPDPYYDEIDGFEYVYNLLNEACQEITNKLKKDEQ